jgi:sulfatase modifying factor 1
MPDGGVRIDRFAGAAAAVAVLAAAVLAAAQCSQANRPESGDTEIRAAAEPAATEDAPVAPPLSPEESAAGFPPATDGQRAIFMGSAEEPPPRKRWDENHYPHSNEQHHELFFPYIENVGGGYIGVGADQNYTMAARARSEWIWLMDYDSIVVWIHKAIIALVLAAPDAAAYRSLWTKGKRDEAMALIEKTWAGSPDLHEIKKTFSMYRGMSDSYHERTMARASKGKCAYWLHDEGSYDYVRAMVQGGRVRALRGDLLAATTLRGIAEAASKLGTTVRVVYLSSAESFFRYNASYRDNFSSLPLDGKSVILRTAAGHEFKLSQADYQWHYNVEPAIHYVGLITKKPAAGGIYSVLKHRKETPIEGLSTIAIDAVPEKPAASEAQAPAPAAGPVLPPDCGQVPEGMACVPGGFFWRGADDMGLNRRPLARVWVGTFWIDRYEVTNALFNACIEAGACKKHEHYKGFMSPDQPAVGITWYNAHAYCAWAGKRLPTEAEWEKAARGPDGDIYPWGDEPPTCELAQFRGCLPDATLPVGSLPAGHYGIFDMAGNGYEWVQDWWSKCYEGCEKPCGEACMKKDPRGPCDGEGESCPGLPLVKILRGGSWHWPAFHLAASWRRPCKPDSGEHRLSVRCAMTPPEGSS